MARAAVESISTPNRDDFAAMLEASFEIRAPAEGSVVRGTIIAIENDFAVVDVGLKTEGRVSLKEFAMPGQPPTVVVGDEVEVYLERVENAMGEAVLSRDKARREESWIRLERAFNEQTRVTGVIFGRVKGGFTVDLDGAVAFLPGSQVDVRPMRDVGPLMNQAQLFQILKMDRRRGNIVVSRRAVLEERRAEERTSLVASLVEKQVVEGVVKNITDYGAFVDLGGVDALLHVTDIAWSRVEKPGDVLSVGQQVEARVLKISNDSGKRRISVGVKQLQAHPWDAMAGKYKAGERVRGTVTRVMEFGAFVELEPGIEGLIHVSEMSWGKKLRSANTLVKPGEIVDAVILGVNTGERRISLGLKQALGDPWAEAAQRFAVGSVIEGPVVSITKFGAFVQLSEGVEGMIHISEMSAEKRINHPQEMLKVGQSVRTQVLAVDTAKRQLRLSMKQLVPSGLDEYIAEHKEGDVVTGRMVEVADGHARVELGEGILARCSVDAASAAAAKTTQGGLDVASSKTGLKPDLSSLGSMLQARWKGGAPAGEAKPEAVRAGQIRKFRIARMDSAGKKIELELA